MSDKFTYLQLDTYTDKVIHRGALIFFYTLNTTAMLFPAPLHNLIFFPYILDNFPLYTPVKLTVLRIRSTQNPQYSKTAVSKTALLKNRSLKNRSTQKPQYSKSAVLKIRSLKNRSTQNPQPQKPQYSKTAVLNTDISNFVFFLKIDTNFGKYMHVLVKQKYIL